MEVGAGAETNGFDSATLDVAKLSVEKTRWGMNGMSADELKMGVVSEVWIV
jgi:hypothetical protein